MSSFDGVIREFNVVVDYFQSSTFTSNSFFLSHCHYDHMKGLFEYDSPFTNHLRQPGVFLYCTDITSHFLTSKYPKYSHLKSKIILLQPNVPSQVQIRGIEGSDSCEEILIVSAIPAGHCPGSVMFLFEGREKTVLYTGDFRVMKGDIQKFRPLLGGTGGVRNIDTLYLDTTFFSLSYWQFPTREKSVQTTCDVANNWISNGPQYHACLLLPAWTGTEYLFTRVAKCLRTKIHVLPGLYSILKYIPEVGDAVTNDFGMQIHAVSIMHFNELKKNLVDMFVKKIQLSAARYENTRTDSKLEWCQGAEDSAYTSVCYSSHCSFTELEDVVRHLKPRKVFPCVKPFGTSKEQVQVLLQNLGVPQMDLSIFSDDGNLAEQVFNQDHAVEEKTEVSYQNRVITADCVTGKMIGQSPVFEKLVDSPPPKRKRLQLTLS